MLSFQKHLCSGISDLRFNVAALSEGMADKNLDGVDMVLDCQPSECRGKRVIAAPSAFPNTTVELDGSEKEHQHVKHSNYKISDPLPFPYSTSAQWETLQNVMVDQGPLFLSCSIVDQKSKQLLAVTSLEKNRFSELVRFDMGTERWTGCTRTRHFRPPKRIGAAAAVARGHVFIFGGYELSNQFDGSKRGVFTSGHRGCADFQASTAGQCVLTPVQRHNAPFLSQAGTMSSKHPSTSSSFALLQLFGYPEWWFKGSCHKGLQLRLKQGSSKLIDALGDFHGYDLGRGEWNALISRDSKPVVHPSSHSGSVVAPWAWRSGGLGCSASTSRLLVHRMLDGQTHQQEFNNDGFKAPTNHHNATTHLVAGNVPGDPLPSARAFHTLVRWGDVLILFGGERSDTRHSPFVNDDCCSNDSLVVVHLNDAWLFDLKDMRWRNVSPLSTTITPPSCRLISPRKVPSGSSLADGNFARRSSLCEMQHDIAPGQFYHYHHPNSDDAGSQRQCNAFPATSTDMLPSAFYATQQQQQQASPRVSSYHTCKDSTADVLEPTVWRPPDVCPESRRATTSTTASVNDYGSGARPEELLSLHPPTSWKGLPVTSTSSSSVSSLYDNTFSPALLPSVAMDNRTFSAVPSLRSQTRQTLSQQTLSQETFKNEQYTELRNGPPPRSGHVAVVYHRVMYIHGGQNAWGPLDDLWGLDLRTFQWRSVTTTGISPGARTGHTAVLVGSGVWIYGGFMREDISMRRRFSTSHSPTRHELSCVNQKSNIYSPRFNDYVSGTLSPSTSIDCNSCSSAFKFFDGHALYHLNFETLQWTEHQCLGTPPHHARYFGRVHGFLKHNSIYFGGPTGVEAPQKSFEMACVDLTLLNVSSSRCLEKHSAQVPKFLSLTKIDPLRSMNALPSSVSNLSDKRRENQVQENALLSQAQYHSQWDGAAHARKPLHTQLFAAENPYLSVHDTTLHPKFPHDASFKTPSLLSSPIPSQREVASKLSCPSHCGYTEGAQNILSSLTPSLDAHSAAAMRCSAATPTCPSLMDAPLPLSPRLDAFFDDLAQTSTLTTADDAFHSATPQDVWYSCSEKETTESFSPLRFLRSLLAWKGETSHNDMPYHSNQCRPSCQAETSSTRTLCDSEHFCPQTAHFDTNNYSQSAKDFEINGKAENTAHSLWRGASCSAELSTAMDQKTFWSPQLSLTTVAYCDGPQRNIFTHDDFSLDGCRRSKNDACCCCCRNYASPPVSIPPSVSLWPPTPPWNTNALTLTPHHTEHDAPCRSELSACEQQTNPFTTAMSQSVKTTDAKSVEDLSSSNVAEEAGHANHHAPARWLLNDQSLLSLLPYLQRDDPSVRTERRTSCMPSTTSGTWSSESTQQDAGAADDAATFSSLKTTLKRSFSKFS